MVTFLKIVLTTLLVIDCILLILLVLIQKSKSGGGLGGAFGGGMGESILGSRAGNVLTKATTILGTAFAVISLSLGLLIVKTDTRFAKLADDAYDPTANPSATAPGGTTPANTPTPPAGTTPANTPTPPAPAPPAPAPPAPAPPANP